jgi:tetratricopeptide (TPR) repeat protein
LTTTGSQRYASLVRLVGLAILGLVATALLARADDVASTAAADAWRICERDEPSVEKVARLQALDRGVQIAEAASAADPKNLRAHFALFCNLGRQLEIAGISWRSLQRLGRLKQTIDTTLALAPDDPDVLVAKGEMLRRLPMVLGGSRREAERLFRRALEIAPAHVAGRLYLAQLLIEQGAVDAQAEVARALDAAERAGTSTHRAMARALAVRMNE